MRLLRIVKWHSGAFELSLGPSRVYFLVLPYFITFPVGFEHRRVFVSYRSLSLSLSSFLTVGDLESSLYLGG